MATYVNDLRLKEIATGDESGTWGTSTNTNLELIAEAFSFGTEAITTNADTHTTTVADGATDPGRSLYLKYTGALDSACTITLGPNTISKVWIIENATTDSGSSGPYNIIIKQEQVTDGKAWFGIGLEPDSKAVIGSQQVPYIYEDRLNGKKVVAALRSMYGMSEEDRAIYGRAGREHVVKNYSFEVFNKTWVDLMLKIHEEEGSWETRKHSNYRL